MSARLRAKVAGPASRRAQALRRGILVHRLLQFLPDVAPAERRARARAWLARPVWGLEAEAVERLTEHLMQVIEMPVLAPLFGPGSRAEQVISGTLRGLGAGMGEGKTVLGQVDRFCVHEGTLWLCDYKTGRSPRAADQAPAAYLRQMATYRAVLQEIYPAMTARCFLIWTDDPAGPKVMELPECLLAQHLHLEVPLG